MDDRRERFAMEYVKDLNATQAAIRAGYSKKGASVTGFNLLRKTKIKALILKYKAKIEDKANITAVDVLRELARLATVDTTQAFKEDGSLKAFKDIPEDLRRCISGVDYEDSISLSPDGLTAKPQIKKIRFWDKNVPLTNLAKYFKMLTDRIEENDNGQLAQLTELLKALQK